MYYFIEKYIKFENKCIRAHWMKIIKTRSKIWGTSLKKCLLEYFVPRERKRYKNE